MSQLRPPTYLSRASLARELDYFESTVDEMVRRGVIPPAMKFLSACVRRRWPGVDMALQGYCLPREGPGLTASQPISMIY
jgi:hypothetical protein